MMTWLILPNDKLALVKGIIEERWTCEDVARYFGLDKLEVECWIRGYEVALRKGWAGLSSQPVGVVE